MGYGKEVVKKSPCTPHRFVRYTGKCWGNRVREFVRVGLGSPKPTDFCCKCGRPRWEIEGLEAAAV